MICIGTVNNVFTLFPIILLPVYQEFEESFVLNVLQFILLNMKQDFIIGTTHPTIIMCAFSKLMVAKQDDTFVSRHRQARWMDAAWEHFHLIKNLYPQLLHRIILKSVSTKLVEPPGIFSCKICILILRNLEKNYRIFI